METIEANVTYTVRVAIEVDRSKESDDEIYEKLIEKADDVIVLGDIKPLITSCEQIPDLED